MVPFLEVLDGMVKRGIEVRLIHAKDPGSNWREDLVDGRKAYFGSANLTGAGMGAKSAGNREFLRLLSIGTDVIQYFHYRLVMKTS